MTETRFTSSQSLLLSDCSVTTLTGRRSQFNTVAFIHGGEMEEKGALSLLAIKGSDLEAEAAVVAVHRHDGAVVQVGDEPPRHLAAALLHQVTALREEVLTLPGRRHQPRLTERHTQKSGFKTQTTY